MKAKNSVLGKVRSKYVIIEIFSFQTTSRKLELINYNKNLKKILGVTIKDYKKMSQRLKIIDKDGKGKEYEFQEPDNIILTFEGEYLNSKKNGYGKEYFYDLDNTRLIKFEGEYLNGKRKKGKEYFLGQLMYEGEYSNGKKSKGKEYYNNSLLFEGEYNNGIKWNGIGKEYYNDKLIFEGEFKNGLRWNGKIYKDKEEYEIKNGNGLIKQYDYQCIKTIEYEYKNGEINGKVKEYIGNTLIYEGEYFDGKRHGNGKQYYNEQLIYEGEFLNGEINGKGKEFYYDGKLRYEGNYKDGLWDGYGKEYYNGELIFEGEFLNGRKLNGKRYNFLKEEYEIKNTSGYIKEYNKFGKLLFEGEFKNGIKHGIGIDYYYNGNIKFEGEYLNGKIWNGKINNYNGNEEFTIYMGKGSIKEFNNYGNIQFEGEYLNGERNGKGKEYYDKCLIFEG